MAEPLLGLSEMSVAYRVQSIPERDQIRARLLEQIPTAEVVIDDGSQPEGWESACAGPWRGYIKTLSQPTVSSHLVVIQDDALVPQGFSEAIEALVEARPESVICLFVPGSAIQTKKAMMQAMLTHHSLTRLAFRDFLPVVAVLWPAETAKAFLEWAAISQLPGMPRPPASDDAVAGAWRRTVREDVLVTVPSLVDHPDDVESTIGRTPHFGKDRSRVAAYSLGEQDPRLIQWH